MDFLWFGLPHAGSAVAILRRTSHCGETPRFLPPFLLAVHNTPLLSAVLSLPPVIKAWSKLMSASPFLAPGLYFCWEFSVFFLLSRLLRSLPRNVALI